jgi:hypothetical protein
LEGAQATEEPTGINVLVGPLQRTDIAEADRIFRVAFGTFLGLANPIDLRTDLLDGGSVSGFRRVTFSQIEEFVRRSG